MSLKSDYSTTQLSISAQSVFLPTRDLSESIAFYQAMGWQLGFREETVALVELGAARFLLQAVYLRELAENMMVHLTVNDAAAWYRRALRLQHEGCFPAMAARAPERTDYGAIVTHVVDPAGVILQFAEIQPLS